MPANSDRWLAHEKSINCSVKIKAGRFRQRYLSCNRFARKYFVRVRCLKKIVFTVYQHGFRYRCSRISSSFGRLFLDPRMANVNGLCFNSRWVDGNGLCEVDRIDCKNSKYVEIFYSICFLILFFLNRQSCISNFPFLLQIPSDQTEDLLPASEVIPETTMMVSETVNFLLITTPTKKTSVRAKFTSWFENFLLHNYIRA